VSKFGLEPEDEEPEITNEAAFTARIASFPAAAPRHRIDVQAMDAAAAQHGFVSREPAISASSPSLSPTNIRRRRIGSPEPTRHLAIRLTVKQYDRFVAYADRYQLTYHDALSQLLDEMER